MSDGLRSGLRPRAGERDAPSNVLLLAPTERGPSVCSDHVSRAGSDALAVLVIEFPRLTGGFANAWSTRDPPWPEALEVLSVCRGSTQTGPVDRLRDRAPESVSVESASVGDDLVLAGIEVAETLASWQDTYDDVVLCLDSLTSLVQLAGVDRTYRFLHVLTEHVRRGDIRAHYHLDHTRHDLRTTFLLETLADAFVVAGDVDVQLPPR